MALRRLVPLVLLALLALTGTAFALAEALRREERAEAVVPRAIARVELRTTAGRVAVRPSTDGTLRLARRATWLVRRPRITTTLRRGILRIDARCPGTLARGTCATDFDLAVPGGADLAVLTGLGDIDVTGAGTRLLLRTDSGEVRLSDGAALLVRAESGRGDVRLGFAAAPVSVVARSEEGSVELAVPGGDDYRVDADGRRVAVEGIVRSDVASRRVLAEAARDVRITGR